MSPGAFVILFVTTAVSVVAAGIVLSVPRNFAGALEAVGDPAFPQLSERVSDVQKVAITHRDYSLVLDRRDESWVAVNRGDYPIKVGLADDLLGSIAGMTRIEPKTDSPDWFQYIQVAGPESPSEARGVRVSASAGPGEVLADAIIGRQSTSMGYSRLGATFVREAAQNQSWLVEGSVFVPSSFQEWFDQLFHRPSTDLVQITILTGDEVVLDFRKPNPASADYALVASDESLGPPGSTGNAEAIRGLAQVVVNVTFDDVRGREGLTVPSGARTVRFVTDSGLQIDATLVEDSGRTWVMFKVAAREGSESAAEAAVIGSRVDRWAFELPERRRNLLSRPLETLVYRPGVTPEAQPAPPSTP